MKKIHRSSVIRTLFLFVLYQVVFVGISYFLLKRVGAFGCFDDCFNFGAGDFILQGKQLYSQIFFNHQPLMAYISAAIQYVTHPETLFELVKYHRIAALVFANICGSFLIVRFGFPMFLSLIIFELTKFYIFGDRFLAEGMIVYPMMYLALLVIHLLLKKSIRSWEYVIAGVCSWFIFWMREPFMPWAFIVLGILFALGLKDKKNRKPMWIGLSVFTFLHLMAVVFLPIREYIFNVIMTNLQHEVAVQPWTIHTFVSIVAYPLLVIIKGFGNIFQNILFVLSVLFCLTFAYELFIKKRYLLVVVLLAMLAISNLRVVPIGSLYYDAFHMIPWYGVFLSCIAVGIADMWNEKKRKGIVVIAISIAVSVITYASIAPQSFIYESIDTPTEFTTGYGNYFVKGEVIKMLSKTGDTMFVEMWEDPIYYVAGVPTAYRYSWYTSIMPKFSMYQEARDEMFANYPPTFYVGACREGDIVSFALSGVYAQNYVQLNNSGTPSCVYIQKAVIPRITKEISGRMNAYGYSLP